MPHTRRTLLTAIGGIAVGIATIGTTGAFDMVELERSATVSVTADADGYLAIEPHESRGEESDLVGYDDDGLIELTVEDNDINDEGITRFHDVFTVTNNGSNNVDLTVEGQTTAGGGMTDGFIVYEGDDPTSTTLAIGAGSAIDLGVQFDSTSTNSPEGLASILFTAEST